MEKSIQYHASVAPSSYKEFDIPSWNSCVDYYEKGEYEKSFFNFLNYLDKNIYSQFSNPEMTLFKIPHCSSVVILKLKNNHLYIEVPFVKLSQSKLIPIMRKCSEINFSYMTLPHIK